MSLYGYTLYTLFRRNARIFKDRVALVSGEQRVCYGTLLDSVDRLACGLTAAGLTAGQRIGILAKNSIEYMYLYGAAAKTGAVLLPINWRLNQEEIEYIISDGAPAALFVDPEFHDMISPATTAAGFLGKCFSMGEAQGAFEAFGALMRNNGVGRQADLNGGDAYVIIHTAAVHGRPRGAVLTHQGPLLAALQLAHRWGLTQDDLNLVALPLFHIAGLALALCAIGTGGSNIILPRFDVDLALKHIKEDRVTFFGEFPPMLKGLLDKAEEGSHDLSSIKHVLGLDHPDTVRKFQEMSGGTFWAVYGQSETSGLVTVAPYFERFGSAGIPLELAEVEIMDDRANILRPGNSGEIVARGPLVFKGYWNLDKDTEHTFRDGWHHTGDRGRIDEDGYLWFEGRAPEKELIKPGGENVYPAEIEKVILDHGDVKDVVVIGVPDAQWGEAIKAVCVLNEGADLAPADLIEFVAARIARFKKPKYVVFVPELPKSADGSFDREKIKADFGKA